MADQTFAQPTFAKIDNVIFKNGTIEVNVLGILRKDAAVDARGFIGIAFHVNKDNEESPLSLLKSPFCIIYRPFDIKSKKDSCIPDTLA